MHPLVLYNVNDPEQAEKAEAAGADILKMCVELGGCLTGEHGVGIEKRDLMRCAIFGRRPQAADQRAPGVRPGFAAESGKGVSARREAGVSLCHAPADELEAGEIVAAARRDKQSARHCRRRHARRVWAAGERRRETLERKA